MSIKHEISQGETRRRSKKNGFAMRLVADLITLSEARDTRENKASEGLALHSYTSGDSGSSLVARKRNDIKGIPGLAVHFNHWSGEKIYHSDSPIAFFRDHLLFRLAARTKVETGRGLAGRLLPVSLWAAHASRLEIEGRFAVPVETGMFICDTVRSGTNYQSSMPLTILSRTYISAPDMEDEYRNAWSALVRSGLLAPPADPRKPTRKVVEALISSREIVGALDSVVQERAEERRREKEMRSTEPMPNKDDGPVF